MCLSRTHRINSRAHASAAISISSSPVELRNRPASRQFQHSAPSVVALPHHLRAVPFQIEPRFRVTHRDLFFPQLDRRLPIPVQPVRRGVTAEQGSKRYPKFHVQLSRFRHQRSISPKHNVNRPDHCDHIGQHASLAHRFQRLQSLQIPDTACARDTALRFRPKPRNSPSVRGPIQSPDTLRPPER